MSEGELDETPFDIDALLEDARPEVAATLRQWFAETEEERDRARRLGEMSKARARRRSRGDPFAVVGASPPLATRLPRWLDEQIRQEFQRIGVSPSEGLRQILEEWWVTRRFPALEYRAPEFLRTAHIRGGPSLEEWRDRDDDRICPPETNEQILDYLALFGWRFDPV